jgi:hypothetical protein
MLHHPLYFLAFKQSSGDFLAQNQQFIFFTNFIRNIGSSICTAEPRTAKHILGPGNKHCLRYDRKLHSAKSLREDTGEI